MSVRIARKLESGARSVWAHPVGRTALLGGAFAGGALLVGWIVGPPVTERAGRAAGDGFARGMELARRAIAGKPDRGDRFG